MSTSQRVFAFVLQLVYAAVSVFLTTRAIYHRIQIKLIGLYKYHGHAPQIIRQDVQNLEKIPNHVAAVLVLADDDDAQETLLDEAAELTAWCIGAGNKVLTVYEKTGALKRMDPNHVRRTISLKLASYFGSKNTPLFKLHIPHDQSSSINVSTSDSSHGAAVTGAHTTANNGISSPTNETNSSPTNTIISAGALATTNEEPFIINLLSIDDGRETIVDLSKTLADMASKHQLSSSDLNVSRIDEELKSATIEEPDLVICFSPTVDLQGFPPWHVRLSEIFCLPDNDSVSYVVFLKALQKFSLCKINVGR